MAELEFQDVTYSFPSNGSKRILSNLSFSIGDGENFTILGPSGSGKSTLLRLCNRLIDPSNGEIRLDGAPIKSLEISELRRRVGLVHQTSVFLRDLSLSQNLLYGIRGEREDSALGDEALIDNLLKQVGLSKPILQQQPSELSGGEAQCICLARTLATRPEILLLDEPTSSLDPSSKLEIERLIQDLQKRQSLTILLVTHDTEQARRLGGQGAILVEGEIVETGEIGQLLDNPSEERSRRLFDNPTTEGAAEDA